MLQFQLGIYLLPQLDVVNCLWLLIWISKHVWFSIYQVHPRNPEYLSVLPTLWAHVWPSITSREKVNRRGKPQDMVLWCGMAVSLAGTGAPQNLHGVWRGHSSQRCSQVLCPDTGGPQAGIRDSEKSTLLAAHSVTGNSRCIYCKHSSPRLTLIPLP